MLRFLIEVQPEDPEEAAALAASIDPALDEVAPLQTGRDPPRRRAATWRVIEEAARRGRDVRIGFEDTLRMADGSPARDNAQLVAAAVEIVQAASLDTDSDRRSPVRIAPRRGAAPGAYCWRVSSSTSRALFLHAAVADGGGRERSWSTASCLRRRLTRC